MKQVLLTIGALFILNLSFGQVRVGIKAGASLSNMKESGPNNNEVRIGYNAGAFVQWKPSTKLLVRPEVLYAVKGFRSPAIGFRVESTSILHYINLPLLVGYRITPNFTLLAGPELGLLINADIKFDDSGYDISKNFKDFDIGANVGLSYEIAENFGLDLRYIYGLKRLTTYAHVDSDGILIGYEKSGENRVLQLGVYYLLLK